MTEADRKKIHFQCRRGMLELDVVFRRFTEQHFEDLSDDELASFAELLSYEDPVLFSWILGAETVPERWVDWIERLRSSEV